MAQAMLDLHLPLPSLNRLDQTKPATFPILLFLVFFSIFIHAKEIHWKTKCFYFKCTVQNYLKVIQHNDNIGTLSLTSLTAMDNSITDVVIKSKHL
jgi:hypothetical protein